MCMKTKSKRDRQAIWNLGLESGEKTMEKSGN